MSYTREKLEELACAGIDLFDILDEHLPPEVFERHLEAIEYAYNTIAPYAGLITGPND